MPTYDLSLGLSVGGTLAASRTSIFNRSITLAAIGALSTSRVSVFTRVVTLATGASLNASRTRTLNVTLTLTGAATLAQIVALAQIAASSPVVVTFGVNTPTVTLSAVTVIPEAAVVVFDALSRGIGPGVPTGGMTAGSGQVARFTIVSVRPRVSLQIRVVSDGQAR